LARDPLEENPLAESDPHDEAAVEDPESSPAIPAAVLASRAAPGALSDHEPWHRARTEREIWNLAWPVILSQALASIVSLIDMAMVGRLGRDAVAAVTYTTQYLNLAQSVLFAVGMASIALMARAIGANEPARARSAFGASILVCGGVAGLFTTIVLLAPNGLLTLLEAPPHVVAVGATYFQLTLGSVLLLAISITVESGFRACRNTRIAMLIALAVTIAKTGLNALLIFGTLGFPRLELVGAGVATLISQVLAVGLFVWAARSGPHADVLRLGTTDLAHAREQLRPMASIALPAIGERVVLNVAIMTYVTVLGHYGTAEVAAYGIGTRLMSFSWIPGTGFSVAAATLVGQALGAADAPGAERAGWRAARFALLVSIVLGLAFGVAREPIARLFTSDAGVVAALGPFMLLLALAQPAMGVHFTLGGALRGAGDTWTPLVAATLGNWGFRVPIAFIASAGMQLGIVWVWAALIADHFMRAIWLTWSFRRGRWKKKVGASVR